MKRFCCLILTALAMTCAAHSELPAPADTSRHKVLFVSVDKDVKLEVLDWGGHGRALVFLAGLGRTAHDFDTFAPKFIQHHHVYAITRRGFGNSSKPEPTEANYAADRLADDVLAVIATLKLDKPFIAGHSIAGEELSSIDNRQREKVSGLIYLDTARAYALYHKPVNGDVVLDLNDLRRRLDRWDYVASAEEDRQQTLDLLNAIDLIALRKGLQAHLKDLDALPPTQHGQSRAARSPEWAYPNAVVLGERKITSLGGNILAIFAVPHDFARNPSPEVRAQAEDDTASSIAQADAFATAVPRARVVRLPYASHMLWQTNEAETFQEMNAFMDRAK